MELLSKTTEFPIASVITLILTLVLLGYWWLTKNYGYYEAKGVFSIPPQLLFGNMKDLYLQRKEISAFYQDLYEKFRDHKFGIIYEGREVVFYVKDPDLIKQITIRDFDHFTDFGFMSKEAANMEINNIGLSNLSGERWKSLKSAISPAFSLKCMKDMSGTISNIGQRMVKRNMKLISEQNNNVLNVDDMINPFVMDCLSQVAYGIDVDAINNPNNEFMKNGSNMLETWRMALMMFMPKVAEIFNIGMMSADKIDFFVNLSRQLLKERESKGNDSNRKDVLAMMVKISKSGGEKFSEEANRFGLGNVKKAELNTDVIARTMLQFFIDGFETVASALVLCIYRLACNPEALEKAVMEVDEVAENLDNDEIGGECANNDLKYLDSVFEENMRLTGVFFTGRSCTKEWTFPGTNITVPKDTRVLIPIGAIQTDEKYFPEPQKFVPERFSPERKSEIQSGTFLPFGMGPRQCMGMKLAKLETKIALFHLLRNFYIEPCEKTKIPLVYDMNRPFRIEGGCHLKFTPKK